MKRPIQIQKGFTKYLKGISAIFLLIASLSVKSNAQTCASLTNVPTAVCRTNTATSYFINNYVGSSTYGFSVIAGSAAINTSSLPIVSITWNTSGDVVIVMTETPIVGTCGNDTFRIRVSDLFAPQVNCNDTVNVSLDEFCNGIITVDMVLEGGGYNPLDYNVVVRDAFTKIPIVGSPNVNSTHVGKILEVSAVHRCSGNSCWGLLRVEDKLKPRLVCRAYVVNCGDAILPGSPKVGFPKPVGAPNPTPVNGQVNTYFSNSPFYDNCSSTTFHYTDRTVQVICPPPAIYIDSIFRSWTATDGYGNTFTCNDTILVTAGSIDSIKCPPNYDGFDRQPIPCDATFAKDANGNPHPSYTGYPTGLGCRNINYIYTDTKLGVCVGTYKILREWLIVDWCTGRDTECVQLIKIVDDRGPILSCQPMQRVSTTNNECTGIATIGLPNILFECSLPLSYEVLVKRGVADPTVIPTSIDAVKDGIVKNANGTYTVNDLPVGLSWVLFIVTDACGNKTECSTEVIVEEKTKPTPVCQLETVVALTTTGFARVNAISFDDGSYDNCALDSMKVRRMVPSTCGGSGNTEFAPYIEFCCDDIRNNPILVVFQVKDKAGNTNECMVEVRLQDKKPPVVTCLPNITVSCGFNYSNLNIFGTYKTNEADRKDIIINDPGNTSSAQPKNWGKDALVIEDCHLNTTYSEVININTCGVGTIQRIFTFQDDFNPAITCTQVISIVNFAPYNGSTIVFPADIIYNGCLSSTDPSFTGRPSWPGTIPCSRLLSTYEDQVFNQVENACYKILRKWIVIDDCNSAGIWTKVQVIKVANKVGPTFTAGTCVNKTFDVLSDNCTGFIELIASAKDDCTDSTLLSWSYKIDLNSNGNIDVTGTSNNASGVYGIGSHTITWTVEDKCGNSSTCSYIFTGIDKKAPSPYCKSGIITVIMPTSGQVTVWALDLDLNSSDNCTEKKALRFSFTSNPNNTNSTYFCSQITNGVSQTFDVRIYVTDEAGNQDYCDTKIIIQDGLGNACPDNLGGGGNTSTALVSGSINTGLNKALEEAMVSINGNMPSMPKYHLTQIDGKFAFPDVPLAQNYFIKAEKNDDILNGVSTQDIVMIQKHILGVNTLTDPYKVIAADVNDSRSVTSRDISDIRKVILGLTNDFPIKKSWRFINSSTANSDPSNPWPVEESIYIQQLGGDININNLVAVKLGDVSGNAKTNNAQNVESRTNASKILFVPEIEFEAQDLITVPVFVENQFTSTGFQLQFEFDPSLLTFQSLQNGVCVLNENNINLELTRAGKIRISYDLVSGINLSKSLFSLVFKANKKGVLSENLALSHDLFVSEIYSGVNEINDLNLNFRNSSEKVVKGFYLYQNEPNPFNSTTTISFVIPKDEYASLKIYDVNGRLLKEISKTFTAGFNSILLEKKDIGVGGILYYNLETSTHRASRKMIMIE
ncbi:MAG: cohesin domain-containing protein [Saprospiraceae bacterium]